MRTPAILHHRVALKEKYFIVKEKSFDRQLNIKFGTVILSPSAAMRSSNEKFQFGCRVPAPL